MYQLSLAREQGRERVFWSVSARDIVCVQEFARFLSLNRPTWHGFRRGRTTDIVLNPQWGQAVSLQMLFESGGWVSGSRALLSYLSAQALNKERVAKALSDGSDSE